jgi:hypothetical protein
VQQQEHYAAAEAEAESVHEPELVQATKIWRSNAKRGKGKDIFHIIYTLVKTLDTW